MLRLSPDHLAAIRSHAAADYPNECVGALLGDWDHSENVRTVRLVLPLLNAAANPRAAFRLDDAERLRVFVQEEKRTGLSVVGFYHSHPDCPARPSETDRRESGFGFSFVIVSVNRGAPAQVASWVFDPEREVFDAEEMRTDLTPAPPPSA